jgi:hypothetical protein
MLILKLGYFDQISMKYRGCSVHCSDMCKPQLFDVTGDTGEARAQQWGVERSTVAILFTPVSHCSIKKLLISVAAA